MKSGKDPALAAGPHCSLESNPVGVDALDPHFIPQIPEVLHDDAGCQQTHGGEDGEAGRRMADSNEHIRKRIQSRGSVVYPASERTELDQRGRER